MVFIAASGSVFFFSYNSFGFVPQYKDVIKCHHLQRKHLLFSAFKKDDYSVCLLTKLIRNDYF